MSTYCHGIWLVAVLAGGCSYQSPLFPAPPDPPAPMPPDPPAPPRDRAPPSSPVPDVALEVPGAGAGASCAIDADCSRGARCEASACATGCLFHDECAGVGATCHPRGLCLDPDGDPLRPHWAEPRIGELRFGGPVDHEAAAPPSLPGTASIAIGGGLERGQTCFETHSAGDPLSAARLDTLSPHGATAQRDATRCGVTVPPPPVAVGRAPVRVRVATPAGQAWVEYANTDRSARRLAGVLAVEWDGAWLRLPIVLDLDAPLEAATEGIVEAHGTPLLMYDAALTVSEAGQVDANGVPRRLVTARARHDSTLLGGPFESSHRVETRLRLELESAADGRGLWGGGYDVRISDGNGPPRQLSGTVLLWPAPPRPGAPPRLSPFVGSISPPDDSFARICPPALVDHAMDDATLAGCLAGQSCCPGPGVWSPDLSDLRPDIAEQWETLSRARRGVEPHLVKHCAVPIADCSVQNQAGEPPCFDWPMCGEADSCYLAPAVADTDDPRCADALDPERREQIVPFSGESPACVDPLRALCAAAIYGRTVDGAAAADALHAGLLRAGITASQVVEPAESEALEAALDRLSFVLAARLEHGWRPALRPAGTEASAELVLAFTDAAAEWTWLAERIAADATRGAQARWLDHRRALDGLALLAAADELAADFLAASEPEAGELAGTAELGEPFRLARAALARSVERGLWASAERHARPGRAVLLPKLAAALGEDPADASAPDRADAFFLDAALALRDRARVALGRLEARRPDFALWSLTVPIDTVLNELTGVVYADHQRTSPLEFIDAELERMAAQPLAGPIAREATRRAGVHAEALGESVELADTLARLTTPAPVWRSGNAPDPAPVWPRPLDDLVAAAEQVAGRAGRADDQIMLEWLYALRAERAAAVEAVRQAGDKLVRLREAHRVAVETHLAGRLRDSALLADGRPLSRRRAVAAVTDSVAHFGAGDEGTSVGGHPREEEWVVHIANEFGLAAQTAVRDPIVEAELPSHGSIALPDAQWRWQLDRRRDPETDTVRIDFDVLPAHGECVRSLTAVKVEALDTAGRVTHLIQASAREPDVELRPVGPRLDHRCADGAAVIQLGERPLLDGAMLEGRPLGERAIGSPGGRWRLTLGPAARSALPDAWSDLRVTFRYHARSIREDR